MGAGKKDPAGFSLVAHDEAEGKSEAGRSLFKELCDDARQKGKSKELNEIHVGRVLDGQRRVTRDLLLKVMDISEVPNEQRAALWERYFGGAPQSIAEVVRRRIILTGSIRDYGEIVDLSHPSLCNILDNRAATAESLFKILTRDAAANFPWKGEELTTQWRHEHEEYHMRKFNSNLLAARVETLFEMRPNASRIEWVERGNKPKSLAKMSKNAIRILLSALRHGEPTDWESVDRVLFGMDSTLIERVEVAHAWLMATKNPPPPRAKREARGPSDDQDGKKKRRGLHLPDEPIPQKAEPYPMELANRSSLRIIQKLLDELQKDEKQAALVTEVSTTLGEVKAIQPKRVNKKKEKPERKLQETKEPNPQPSHRTERTKAPEKLITTDDEAVSHETAVESDETPFKEEKKEINDSTAIVTTSDDVVTDEGVADSEPEAETELTIDEPISEEEVEEDPETLLFGPPREALTDDDDTYEEAIPDFSRYNSVWQLAEFLENFSGREVVGYNNAEEAAHLVAVNIASRAPFSINDTASAMKVLIYCFGRYPDSASTKLLTAAVEKSIGAESNVPTAKLLQLLTAEPRFRMFLIYYRDQHPESPITKLFSPFTDLAALEAPEDFDRYAQTDVDRSYQEILYPPPEPKVDEKKMAKRGKAGATERAAKLLEEDSVWDH